MEQIVEQIRNGSGLVTCPPNWGALYIIVIYPHGGGMPRRGRETCLDTPMPLTTGWVSVI